MVLGHAMSIGGDDGMKKWKKSASEYDSSCLDD